MPQKFDIYPIRSSYATPPNAAISFLRSPDPVAQFAMKLLESPGAMLSATDDGEDSAGRQKARPLSVSESVSRAFDIAVAAFDEAEKRDLMVDIPSFSQIEEDAKKPSGQ